MIDQTIKVGTLELKNRLVIPPLRYGRFQQALTVLSSTAPTDICLTSSILR